MSVSLVLAIQVPTGILPASFHSDVRKGEWFPGNDDRSIFVYNMITPFSFWCFLFRDNRFFSMLVSMSTVLPVLSV